MNVNWNNLLKADEKELFTFQSSAKIHVSNFLWYIFGTMIFGAGLQLLLKYFALDWSAIHTTIVFIGVVSFSEMLRRKTEYCVTDKRIIRKTDLGFFENVTNFYYADFSEIYLWSRYGFIFGYDHLQMMRSGFMNDFFGHVTIPGLSNSDAQKILDILETILVDKDSEILKG